MYAPTDNTTSRRSEQAADSAYLPAGNLIGRWARRRRQITQWAYPRLRALAAVRFAVGIFLAGLGALILSHGYWFAAIPLAGAALFFSFAFRDSSAARLTASAPASTSLARPDGAR